MTQTSRLNQSGAVPSQAPAAEESEPTEHLPPTNIRRNGGPRTRLGKTESRRSALKHGLSAKVVLLADESPAEFKRWCRAYRDYFKPVGFPEEVEVIELARLKWCLRRVSAAESAEIELERRYNSRAADRQKRDREEAQTIEAEVDGQFSVDTKTSRHTNRMVEIPRPGLMDRYDNPLIRQKCLNLLISLQESIQLRLFFPPRDHQIIDKIFGVRSPSEFRFFYSVCAEPEKWITLEPFKKFDLPVAERSELFLIYLKEVIRRYSNLAKRMDVDPAWRESLESKAAVVPEHLLRYRATLERDYDRILNRLLQQQQLRKGQPVPPTLNVNLTR